MKLLALGVACSGGDHRRQQWFVDGERRLGLPGEVPDALRHALKLPIPGEADVLVVHAFPIYAVLGDGGMWRLDWVAHRCTDP